MRKFYILNGYKIIYRPNHPRALSNGYVYEHILVAEEKIGRTLLANEQVHHKDKNKLNNEPENLEVIVQIEHLKIHWRERREVS